MDYKTSLSAAVIGIGLLGPLQARAEIHGDGRDPIDVEHYCRFIRDPSASFVADMLIAGNPEEVAAATGVPGVQLPIKLPGGLPGEESPVAYWYYPWSYDRGVVLFFVKDAPRAAASISAIGFDVPDC